MQHSWGGAWQQHAHPKCVHATAPSRLPNRQFRHLHTAKAAAQHSTISSLPEWLHSRGGVERVQLQGRELRAAQAGETGNWLRSMHHSEWEMMIGCAAQPICI